MPKVISILQPVYLPWLGYFEQAALADHFVFMDDVQYTRKDWRNRNRIKTASGSIWLTVPVKKHPLGARINEIEINYAQDWIHRHLRSLELNYGKTPHFQPLFSVLAEELGRRPVHLWELDCRLIERMASFLDIDTPTSRSSAVPYTPESIGDKNQRIIDLCRHHGAGILYDGAKAADFIDVTRFREAGIEVIFQSYVHPCYPQLHGEFLSHQSALDLIMNTGPEAGAILRSSPRPAPLQPKQPSLRTSPDDHAALSLHHR